MAIINPNLLISAAVLQDYLVDKDGTPLSAGVITLFSDTQRSILQPWYMQQGTNPPYTYVPLPNPMTLSAAGTIQDADGNDVIPYFYPYTYDPFTDSYTNVFNSYYVTVYNSNGELQFTRSNFPFVANPGSTSPIDTNENLLINNVFWRNSGNTNVGVGGNSPTGTISINSINYSYWTVAPSQHDGFIMSDISYFKNAVDGTETISFPTFVSNFANQILVGDVTPECYMNINCGAPGTSSTRYLQIPLSLHIDSLSGFTQDIFTLQAMSVDNLNEVLTIGIYQFCGTGVTTPAIAQKTITLGPGWNKFSLNLPIPSAQGVTVGVGGDDALYVQIGFPTTGAFNVNIAVPSFYLSNTASTNSFQTYDKVNSIASSPRTGDSRASLNSFSPYGWVPANDGSIGSSTSSATTRANTDTWPLYNLIWNGVNNTFAPVTGGRGANSYADFSANKPMALTKALGRVLIGLPTSSTFTYNFSTQLLTVADTTLYYQGSPVLLSTNGTLPNAFTAGTVYYVIPVSGTTFKLASSYANAILGTAVAAGTSNGTGVQTVSFALGGSFGEDQHTQLVAELATHQHGPDSVNSGTNFIQSRPPGTGTGALAGGSTQIGLLNTGFAGSSLPFNIVQPSTYLNVFIKL